jgi:hypothetical protein
MPGVRIQHATKRSCTFTLIDNGRPYREPWTCPPPPVGCASTHQFKTYHFRLDESGSAIVSREIWERLEVLAALLRLRGRPGHGFVFANEVKDPPKQIIRVPVLRRTIEAQAPGETHG